MIFEKTWQLVAAGRKYATRRPLKPTEHIAEDALYIKGRLYRQKGQELSVQPAYGGRGIWVRQDEDGNWQPHFAYPAQAKWAASQLKNAGYTPLRIRLLQIYKQPLAAITDAQAIAEGITQNEAGIWVTPEGQTAMTPQHAFFALWETIHPKGRYSLWENPSVTVYEFATLHLMK